MEGSGRSLLQILSHQLCGASEENPRVSKLQDFRCPGRDSYRAFSNYELKAIALC
jgi:hypothetical protein